MKRQLTRDRNGVLRDPFGRPFTIDMDEVRRARRIADHNRQPNAKKQSVPLAPHVKRT